MTTQDVVVRGTAPAGARVVRDITFGPDDDALANRAGAWVMRVELDEEPNVLRFRIEDDDATAVDWLITYDPSIAAPPTEPVRIAVPTFPPLPTESPTDPPEPTVPAQPTPQATAEPPEDDFIEFFDGVHEIGVDIPPGTYRTEFEAVGCYWARLRGFSGDVDDIIANDFSSGYQVVTIGRRDVAFESSGCEFWTSDVSRVTESDVAFGEGTFIVGTDIRPGTYESGEGEGCYWARLSGFGGRIQDIIANDFRSGGRAIVQIRARDTGFTSNGCGIWTRR